MGQSGVASGDNNIAIHRVEYVLQPII